VPFGFVINRLGASCNATRSDRRWLASVMPSPKPASGDAWQWHASNKTVDARGVRSG
jgi:hypothetical protein